MSVVRFIPYTNRLSKLIKAPGGKRVEAALESADENLAAIKAPAMASIDEQIATVQQLAAASPLPLEALEQVYQASNQIVGLGGVFGLQDLSRAAYSLCELIDRTRDQGGPDFGAMKVHVDSLRLMRLGEALPEVERAKVLDGLSSVVQRAGRGGA